MNRNAIKILTVALLTTMLSGCEKESVISSYIEQGEGSEFILLEKNLPEISTQSDLVINYDVDMLRELFLREIEAQKDMVILEVLSHMVPADFLQRSAEELLYPELYQLNVGQGTAEEFAEYESIEPVIDDKGIDYYLSLPTLESFSLEIYNTDQTILNFSLYEMSKDVEYSYMLTGEDGITYSSDVIDSDSCCVAITLDTCLPYQQYTIEMSTSDDKSAIHSGYPRLTYALKEYREKVAIQLMEEFSQVSNEEQLQYFAPKCKSFLREERYDSVPSFDDIMQMSNDEEVSDEQLLSSIAGWDLVFGQDGVGLMNMDIDTDESISIEVDTDEVDNYIRTAMEEGVIPSYYVKFNGKWFVDLNLLPDGEVFVNCWDFSYPVTFMRGVLPETINNNFTLDKIDSIGDEVFGLFHNETGTVSLMAKCGVLGENLEINLVY